MLNGEHGLNSWGDLKAALIPQQRNAKPRETGITMMLDRCQGLISTEDLLQLAGDHIDQIKLSFGTSLFLHEGVLRRKIELARNYGIEIYPGGTLMESALMRGVFPDFVKLVRNMRFTAIEISDGSIEMSRGERNDAIQRTLDAGLIAISEVGKKDPTVVVSAENTVEQILADLEAGSRWVIIEARESGRVGMYDKEGILQQDKLLDILNLLPREHHDRLIWEAPRSRQQADMIKLCGSNVNLGNIKPRDALGLEAQRCGLRFETLHHFADSVPT